MSKRAISDQLYTVKSLELAFHPRPFFLQRAVCLEQLPFAVLITLTATHLALVSLATAIRVYPTPSLLTAHLRQGAPRVRMVKGCGETRYSPICCAKRARVGPVTYPVAFELVAVRVITSTISIRFAYTIGKGVA